MLYDASLDHQQTIGGTKLSFFYATSPSAVNVEKVDGAVQDRYPGYAQHSRLESVYNINDSGKANVITALFPSDFNTAKPGARRITADEVTGGIIDHENDLEDIILESANEKNHMVEGLSFHAKAIIARSSADVIVFYFARHGTAFLSGSVGFESDSPVSIYVKGNEGVIIANGAVIKLIGPGMDTVQFESNVTVLSFGIDYIEVEIPAGELRF